MAAEPSCGRTGAQSSRSRVSAPMNVSNSLNMATSIFAEQLRESRLRKSYRYGTERICTPEETWERVRPLLPAFGITRVADITWLDSIGVPVFAAIRPNSRTLAQSNGKGLTSMQARVSAVMEGIELWHSEELRACDLIAPINGMNRKGLLTYDPYELSLRPESFLCDEIPIEWISCEDIANGTRTYLPRELVSLDFCVEHRASFPCFASDSNGLASGNTHLEAALHGLSEVIERDAIMQYATRVTKSPRRLVAPETITSVLCQQLIERCRRAGAKVYVEDISSEFGLPVFQASVSLDDHHGLLSGYGCHPNRETALLRAITEVLQERSTLISAARDDIHASSYYLPRRLLTQQSLAKQLAERESLVDYETVPNLENEYIENDLRTIIATLKKKLDTPVLLVDLTKHEYAIPVVKIVVPMMQMPTNALLAIRTGRSASSNLVLPGSEEGR
jgi:YcaO-like protein with predicted kinase domain